MTVGVNAAAADPSLSPRTRLRELLARWVRVGSSSPFNVRVRSYVLRGLEFDQLLRDFRAFWLENAETYRGSHLRVVASTVDSRS